MKQTTNLIISPQRSHKDHSSVKSISNVNTLSADKNREYFVIFSYINYYKHKRPNKQESKVMTLINISKQEETGQDLFRGLYKEQKDQIQSLKTSSCLL